MDWLSMSTVLFFNTFALVAKSCAGSSNEGSASKVMSSKCLSLPPGHNEPYRISGSDLDDRTVFQIFCNTTYHTLSAYVTQIALKNIRKKYEEQDVNYENVVTILREVGIKIPDQFIGAPWRLGVEWRTYLADLVRKQIPYIYFKPNNLSVIDETRNKRSCLGMDVVGRNVILSDVMDLYTENVNRETDCTICRFCNWELRILATEKFYIDRDVDGRFVSTDIERLKYMSVVAPVWEVKAEPGETRTIKLDGDRTSVEGGFFIGVYSKITDASKLFISASGADGKPKYDGGNAGLIHLVNTSGKVTVHNEACPGSGKYDGRFTESQYIPGHVVSDMHADMITGSIFDCFSSQFDDFFNQLDSHVKFTIGPLSLAKELNSIEYEFYARDDHISYCPVKVERRMENYFKKNLELTKKELGNPDPADKRALGIIASSTLGQLVSNWKLDRTPNGFSTIRYLGDVGKELKLLIETFESNKIGLNIKLEMAVMKEKVESAATLDAKVYEVKNFMKHTVSPASRMAEDVTKATSDKLLIALKTFLEAEDDLNVVENLKNGFEDLLPFKYIFSGLEIVETVISFFGPSGSISKTHERSFGAGVSIFGAFLEAGRAHSHTSEPFNKTIRDEKIEYYKDRIDNLPLRMHDDVEENDTDYLSLIPQAKDEVDNLLGKIKSNILKKDQLESAIQSSKAKTKGFMLFIKKLHNTFIPTLKEMARYNRKKLSIANRTSRSKLAVNTRDIRNVLNNMRIQLGYFSEWISVTQDTTSKQGGEVPGETAVFNTLQFHFDSLGEALEGIFELYGQIGMHQERHDMAKFIEIANTPNIDEDTETEDFKGQIILERRLFSFITNLLLEKHNKALYAFKQWVFPFAKYYIEGKRFLTLNISPDKSFAEVAESCKRVIDEFGDDLEYDMPQTRKTKFEWFHDYSQFTSTRSYGRPFYIWKNSKWQHAIRRLFQGEEIRMKADVDMIGHDENTKNFFKDKMAIKFIGIEMFIKAHDESLQQELKKALNTFEMYMKHSGISIYKVNGQQFVIRSDPQHLVYNFEDNVNLRNVDGYKQGIYSDYLLSPYTWWTFSIGNVTSSYEKLQKFVNKVDLELHGSGTFLNVRKAIEKHPTFLKDLNMAEYYEIYEPNNYEIGEIPAEGVQRGCGWGPTQPGNNLNLAFPGSVQQTLVTSIHQEKCYHKLKCDGGNDSFAIIGIYQLVSDPDNDDFEDYLKTTGIVGTSYKGYSEDFRSKIRGSKMVIVTFNMVSNNKYYVETNVDHNILEFTFVTGSEFETMLGDGRKVSNIINVNVEQKSVMGILKFTDFEATNEFIFCYWGVKVTLKAKDAEAMLTFRRLDDSV